METNLKNSKYIKTNDGVKLHYIDIGSGRPIVMLHGWAQSAELFKHQIDGLKKHYRVIAIDMRGHGKSEKTNHGYKISRLAKDLDDVLTALNLTKVILLGHSMGSSVIWCYWDLFGSERLAKLIFIDQQAFMLENPQWTEEQNKIVGGIQSINSLFDMVNTISGENGADFIKKFTGGRFTDKVSKEVVNWVIEQNMQLPRDYGAALFLNHATQDWSDVIPRINIPTLIITGRASNKPLQSQEWISKQILNSRLEIFEEEEGGEHFMFIENPGKFNKVVTEFIELNKSDIRLK